MTQETQIRLRPDGSIDTGYYMNRGRAARSEQAHKLARAGGRRVSAVAMAGTAIFAALLLMPVVF